MLAQLPLDLAAFKVTENRPYTVAGGAGLVLLLTFFILPLSNGFANQSNAAVAIATDGSWGWLLWLIPLAGIAAMAAAVRVTRGAISGQAHHTQGLVLLASGALLGGFLIGLLVIALQVAGSVGFGLGIGFWVLLLGLFTIAGCGTLIAHHALASPDPDRAQAPMPLPPARSTPPANPAMRYRQPGY